MPVTQKRGHAIDMCNGPLLPKLVRFSIPLMLSTILQLLFHAADIIVVSRFSGDECLAAVGATSSLNTLLVNLVIGFSVGTNIQASWERGSGRHEEFRRTAHTAVLLGALGGMALLVVGCIGAEQFLVWMQVPDSIRGMSTLYVRICFFGKPATMVYNVGAALLRSVGDTARTVRYLVISGVTNVALNLLFVVGFHRNVDGVAAATVISNYVSAALMVRCLIREPEISLDLRQLRLERDKLKAILSVGIPASIQRTLFSVANVMVASSVNSFGELAIAGNSASGNVESFMHTAADALAEGTLTFVSQNVGAKKWDRVRRTIVVSCLCVVISSTVIAVVANIFAPALLGIYSETETVIEAGLVRFRMLISLYGLCGLMKVMQNVLRGAGYSRMSTIISLMGAWGVRVMWLLTVFQIPRFHTIRVVYMSYPVTWVATLAAYLICWAFVSRRVKQAMTGGG